MNKKGIKTTIVAFLILIVGIGLVTALVLDKLTPTNFGIAMSSVTALGVTVIGFLSKDADKSHTNSN